MLVLTLLVCQEFLRLTSKVARHFIVVKWPFQMLCVSANQIPLGRFFTQPAVPQLTFLCQRCALVACRVLRKSCYLINITVSNIIKVIFNLLLLLFLVMWQDLKLKRFSYLSLKSCKCNNCALFREIAPKFLGIVLFTLIVKANKPPIGIFMEMVKMIYVCIKPWTFCRENVKASSNRHHATLNFRPNQYIKEICLFKCTFHKHIYQSEVVQMFMVCLLLVDCNLFAVRQAWSETMPIS